MHPTSNGLPRAEPEDVLDPQRPIVDAHLHLWEFAGYRYFLEEHAQDLATCGHHVEASVYVECFSMYRATGPEHLKPVGETEYAVGQAAMAASGKYTSCRVGAGIVGYSDMTQGQLTHEAIEAHIAAGNGRFRRYSPARQVGCRPGRQRQVQCGRAWSVSVAIIQ
jgi:hypothetical protein